MRDARAAAALAAQTRCLSCPDRGPRQGADVAPSRLCGLLLSAAKLGELCLDRDIVNLPDQNFRSTETMSG